MWVQSLDGEEPLEEGMAIHSSILAGRILWTEEPGGLYFIGLQTVGHNWGDLAAPKLSSTLNSDTCLIVIKVIIRQSFSLAKV